MIPFQGFAWDIIVPSSSFNSSIGEPQPAMFLIAACRFGREVSHLIPGRAHAVGIPNRFEQEFEMASPAVLTWVVH